MIGVLALQGGFAAHLARLAELGAPARAVRICAELENLDGLILPGGESTAMVKLACGDLLSGVRAVAARGVPLLGTCAGAVLMAESLEAIDVGIERNAYGAQLQSFIAPVATELGPLEGVFIRAPALHSLGSGVHVLGRVGDDPVWVRQGLHSACTFHPELSRDHAVHRNFLDVCQEESQP